MRLVRTSTDLCKRVLAIDTATRYASLALLDETGVISEQTWRSENNHSVELMPALARMLSQQKLKPQSLTGVAVATGPGSFTGLRIGMSVAKGLCLALGVPIVGIPTLDIITYAVGDPGGRVLAVLEAGRGRICVGAYHFEEGLPVQEGETKLVSISAWTVKADKPVLVAGEVSAELAQRLFEQANAHNIAVASLAGSLRRAGYLAELAWERLCQGKTDDLDTLAPVYAPSRARLDGAPRSTPGQS
ncbi:MAG TPA: tRNA (adenosine(37)-N6)-threonylcarbamoyltransferase complex dimerization subunit type 1 TsaB [Anaerolineae bacterium]|nr:tRNA (adenosine(37)-N6)-threonylcarbamoyltransferase complex dimerization subunit type 1 TsaB [Anaerolineae bacterium]